MADIVRFSLLNPLRMVRATNVKDSYAVDKLPSWELSKEYITKFCNLQYTNADYEGQVADTLVMQFDVDLSLCDIALSYWKIKNCTTGAVVSYMTPICAIPNGDFYNITVVGSLNLTEDQYFVEAYFPHLDGLNNDLFYSEKFMVVDHFPDSLHIIAAHDGNEWDTFFLQDALGTLPILFEYRVEGGYQSKDFVPNCDEDDYDNQNHENTILYYVPFNERKLTFGNGAGIPEREIDLMNRIRGCLYKWINGKLISIPKGSKWESEFVGINPFAVWKISVQDMVNKFSDTHEFVVILPDPIDPPDPAPPTPNPIGVLIFNQMLP